MALRLIVDQMNECRARQARSLSAFYSGETDRHPCGTSGRRFVLPPEDDRSCRDTSVAGYPFSEWGNAAGSEIC